MKRTSFLTLAVDVKMARYCYFSSTISGSGTLNLYGGGERVASPTKGIFIVNGRKVVRSAGN